MWKWGLLGARSQGSTEQPSWRAGSLAKTNSDFIKNKFSIVVDLSYIGFISFLFFFFLKNTLKYLSWLFILLGVPQSLYLVCPHYPYPGPSLSYLISCLSVSYPFPVEVGLVLGRKVEMITAQVGSGWEEPRVMLEKSFLGMSPWARQLTAGISDLYLEEMSTAVMAVCQCKLVTT